MKTTVKSEQEAKDFLQSLFDSNVEAGMTQVKAHASVKNYLAKNEFVLEDGTKIEISLDAVEDAVDTKKNIQSNMTLGTSPKKVPSGKELPSVEVTEDWERVDQNTFGYKCIGEQARAFWLHKKGAYTDPRITLQTKADYAVRTKAAPTTFASELVGADGSFLVAPDFAKQVYLAYSSEESIGSLCDVQKTSSSSPVVPVDETTPWSTSGVQAYWTGQGSAITNSKPAFQQRNLTLATLAALVPVTDQLMEDTALLSGYFEKKVPQKLRWLRDDAIIRGTGASQPLGVLNGPGTITVTRTTALQTVLADLDTMYASLLPGTLDDSEGAVWLMDKVTRARINELTSGTSGFPIGLQNYTIKDKIVQAIFGIPVRTSLHCSSLGTKGDIILADFKRGYAYFEHNSGMQAAASAHLYFDAISQALRYHIRVAGEPYVKTAITPPNDANNVMSHFVTLSTKLS